MVTHKLQNYLRTYRKQTGLSQAEVAYLLGCKVASKISRHEQLRRCPMLRTALAYEVILGVPVRELLAGLYADVEKDVLKRIGILGKRLHKAKPSRVNDKKLESLAAALRISRLHKSARR